jgi:hypothetical protein
MGIRDALDAWDWDGRGLPACRICGLNAFDFLGDKYAVDRATQDEMLGWYGDWVAVDGAFYCARCLRRDMPCPIRRSALPPLVVLP